MKPFSLFFFSLLLSFHGAWATSAEEVSTKAKDATAAAVSYTKEQKEAFQKDMEIKLNSIKEEIAELNSQVAYKTGEAKNEMRAQVKALETRQQVLKKDLAKLKQSSGNAWTEMKMGVSKAWDALSESYNKAKSEFKEAQ